MNIESDYVPYAPLDALPKGPVLVLAPHADDEVIGCGGALAQHVRRGDTIKVVIMTDGVAATEHSSKVDSDMYKSLRLQESAMAARVLGYSAPESLGIGDRDLGEWPQLDSAILSLARKVNATTVYAPSVSEVHPDHHVLGRALCRVSSQLPPNTTLMFYEVGCPAAINVLVDITTEIELKRAALQCFESQLMLRDYLKHMEALNVYRTYTLAPETKAAEGYVSITAAQLVDNPLRCFGRSRTTDAFTAEYADR